MAPGRSTRRLVGIEFLKITRCCTRRRPHGGLEALGLLRGRVRGVGICRFVGRGKLVKRLLFGTAQALLLALALFCQFFLPFLEAVVTLGQGHLGVRVGVEVATVGPEAR